MSLFSGKVVSAKFLDYPNNMIIEVLYKEGDSVVPFILEVDFTQQDFLDLLQDITLEEIQKNTEDSKKQEFSVFEKMITAEVNKRWEAESDKIKAAYDKAEQYVREIIEKETQQISNAWKEIDNNWGILKNEYNKLESAWKEIEKESANVEKSWKEIEQGYKKVDEYAEEEKSKKMDEVQSEFQKLRQELAVRFNTGTSIAKLDAKDIFQQLSGNEEDKDFVFNLKIAILEDPTIAKSKDKNMKLAIRKSKSVTELLAIYYAQKAA